MSPDLTVLSSETLMSFFPGIVLRDAGLYYFPYEAGGKRRIDRESDRTLRGVIRPQLVFEKFVHRSCREEEAAMFGERGKANKRAFVFIHRHTIADDFGRFRRGSRTDDGANFF